VSIRTNADDVAATLGLTVASGALDIFIADAALWVDNNLEGQTCVDADKLEFIERHIAAHLYTQSQEGSTGQLVGAARADINERYAQRKGTEAGITTFIRSAAAYDPCGIVAEFWLGKRRLRYHVGAGYDTRHTGGGG
jgi:hypothetical protein